MQNEHTLIKHSKTSWIMEFIPQNVYRSWGLWTLWHLCNLRGQFV